MSLLPSQHQRVRPVFAGVPPVPCRRGVGDHAHPPGARRGQQHVPSLPRTGGGGGSDGAHGVTVTRGVEHRQVPVPGGFTPRASRRIQQSDGLPGYDSRCRRGRCLSSRPRRTHSVPLSASTPTCPRRPGRFASWICGRRRGRETLRLRPHAPLPTRGMPRPNSSGTSSGASGTAWRSPSSSTHACLPRTPPIC